jgi:multidrug efflux pump subunit AcrA (membrane-fusion protein)
LATGHHLLLAGICNIASTRPAKEHAVTQQDLDNAVQNNISAKAEVKVATSQVEAARAQIEAASAAVEAAQAALEAANVNLGFTKLYSPIDGIAGNAQIQIGNLVGPASANPVTTVSTVDPIKVTFAVSEQEYLRLSQQYKPTEGELPEICNGCRCSSSHTINIELRPCKEKRDENDHQTH